MAKLQSKWLFLDAQSLEDNGSGSLRVKVTGAIERTAGGLNIVAASITDAMLYGAIAFTKLADYANIARLDQAENILAAWNFGANLPTATADPTTGNQLCRKAYVDSIASGLLPKTAAKALADSAITLSGTKTIDGVSCGVGDRVLVTAQASGVDNGIWVVASSAWTRATDLAAGAQAAGAYVFVDQGTVYGGQGWICSTSSAADTVGTDALTWQKFNDVSNYTAGDGIAIVGSVIATNPGNGLQHSGGYLVVKPATSGGLEVDSNGVKIGAGLVTYAMLAAAAIGTGATQIAAGNHDHGALAGGALKYFGTDGSGTVGMHALPASGGTTLLVETFTLSATNITNKYVNLAQAPGTPAKTILIIKGAGGQFYGDDFAMDGTYTTRLKWDSLSLDGVLAAGDKLTVMYQ